VGATGAASAPGPAQTAGAAPGTATASAADAAAETAGTAGADAAGGTGTTGGPSGTAGPDTAGGSASPGAGDTRALGDRWALGRIALIRESAEPLYHQVYTQLRRLILDRSGAGPAPRLPASRALADALGVSRNTVLLAYQRLREDGLVTGRAGGGTRISRRGPAARRTGGRARPDAAGAPAGPAAPPVTPVAGLPDHRPGAAHSGGPTAGPPPSPRRVDTLLTPPVDLFPTQLWTALLGRRLRRAPHGVLTDVPPLGHPALREAIAAYLGATRGVVCAPGQVVVTRGARSAVELLGQCLLRPGERFWHEDPCHPALVRALTMYGAVPCPVPVDADGADPDAAASPAPSSRLALVSAAHQLPLGAALSAPRRALLLERAARNGSVVVDVDWDGAFLAPGAPPPLWTEARDGQVVHVGTFNSVLFPQLHVGFLVVPPELTARAAARAREVDGEVPALTQAALADFLNHHRFVRYLDDLTRASARRRSALLAALDRLPGNPRPLPGHLHGGSFLAVRFSGRAARRAFTDAAPPALRPVPLELCASRPGAVPLGLAFGYAGVREHDLG
jgi:GntR family transcriptional regulator/MocR family aminotransferase